MTAHEPVTAAQVKALRQLHTRAGRESHRRYLAEGEHLTQEALAEGQALSILVERSKLAQFQQYTHRGVPVMLLTDKQFQQISDTRAPQGIAAVCPMPGNASAEALGPLVVALNSVQDPGNVGTILRTMDAAGFTGLLLDGQCADAFSPKVLRAAMGAALRIPIRRVQSLTEALPALQGHTRIAGALDGAPFYAREPVEEPLCLIIGNEGAGINPEVMALADVRLRLPILGRAESLNAAVAAGIMMYDFVRVALKRDAERNPLP